MKRAAARITRRKITFHASGRSWCRCPAPEIGTSRRSSRLLSCRRWLPIPRARQFTGDLAFGQTVAVKIHDTDRYGRTVAEIILPDGRNLNHELVRAGFAWWYQQYARNENALAALQQQARAARKGVWADPHAVAPWEWRRTSRTRPVGARP